MKMNNTPLLDQLTSPSKIKKLSTKELISLSDELRKEQGVSHG